MSSFLRDSSYHDMYYKGCGLLCAHKKSFNTAIPVRSLGPYMYVHYCTCIVHILVWTYLFLLTSFFDCLSFCGLFLKHPYKRFFPFYILYFYLSLSLSLSPNLSTYTHSLSNSLHTHSFSQTLHTHCLSLSVYILSICLHTHSLYFSTYTDSICLHTHPISLSISLHKLPLSLYHSTKKLGI